MVFYVQNLARVSTLESYAVIKSGSKQYKVVENQKILVDRLAVEAEQNLELNQVLLFRNAEGKITVSSAGKSIATVQAKVVKHLRGKKIIVFKKKRRQGYQKKQGHRQNYTQLLIEKIIAN